MSVQALGYIGVRAKNLEDWASFGTRFLGMQRVDQTRATLAFRMDDRKQRLVVAADGGEGIAFMGWEVADAAALDALAQRLEQGGTKVEHGSRALADERRVAGLIVVHDPAGNRIELFHGAETTSDPFLPGRNISGFRTGPLGMGHVVMNFKRVAEVMTFYRDLLGFRLTDYFTAPFPAYFCHVNERHHSLAFSEVGKDGVHHMMVELFSLDDVGQAYDIALGEEGRIATTLGRHAGDYMTSFYSWNPSGFMTEYGWGGQSIDRDTWQPVERTCGPSLWGHDRKWMPQEKQAEMRALRMKAADQGLRQPVQVLQGNHRIMPGVCPWWDSMTDERTSG